MMALPLSLLQGARDARDACALEVRQAAQALAQADATLGQLRDFQGHLLGRCPTRSLAPLSASALPDWQAFYAGLHRALAQQSGEAQGRGAQHAQAQARLAKAQTRLMALEALEARHSAVQALQVQRRAQRECDEFAARASLASGTSRALEASRGQPRAVAR